MPKTTVRTQMPSGKSPSMTPSGGVYDHNPHAPFTRKHDLGNGGIPLKFGETLGAKERPATRVTAPGLAPGRQGSPSGK